MIKAHEQHQYQAFFGQQTDLLWEHLPSSLHCTTRNSIIPPLNLLRI
jgi:hypothetical protein